MRLLLFLALCPAVAAVAAEPPARAEPAATARWDRVTVPPSKTSIYVGSVTLTMPEFTRRDEGYESSYTARVIPYFFFNESGRIRIEFSAVQLERLARGEVVEFTGAGRRDDGTERRVEGKATPADARSGKLKVRVFVSKSTELIFNTTYRFED